MIRSIALVVLLVATLMQANEDLPVQEVTQQIRPFDGYYLNYGSGPYDWIYIQRETGYLFKLVGPNGEGLLDWNRFPEMLFDSIEIDTENGNVTLVAKTNENMPLVYEYNGTRFFSGENTMFGGLVVEEGSGIWQLESEPRGAYGFIQNKLVESDGAIIDYAVSEDGLSIIIAETGAEISYSLEHAYQLVGYLGDDCFSVRYDASLTPDASEGNFYTTLCKID